MLPTVAVFTDTYLPTVNGVTYTIETWRDRWVARGGRMDVVYPRSDHEPSDGEYPVRSVAFPFYEGFRAGLPQIPSAVRSADVVHAHTPFAVGLGARRLARKSDAPLVASYHTPTAEYADYIADGALSGVVETGARTYERWYMNRVDAVVVPSEPAREHLREIDVTAPIHVVPNGVDVEFFRPPADDGSAFRDRYDLPPGPLVGYTGRHGYEKNLPELVRAGVGLDATLVFAGDGPARDGLERLAADLDVDARFLGFLDREELPAFYAALAVFAFPSPVETQGLVALEANACGTPVAGVAAGALADTIDDGVTGYTAPPDDVQAFRQTIERTLSERDQLRENCLDGRDETSVEHAMDELASLYERVLRTADR